MPRTNGCAKSDQNNLIESASHATGSLLIWDTGEYEILPYHEVVTDQTTDNELSDTNEDVQDVESSESERLFSSFQASHIRLRLHGVRLPENYTISLRMTKDNRHLHAANKKEAVRRPNKRLRRTMPSTVAQTAFESTESDSDTIDNGGIQTPPDYGDSSAADILSDDDETIRANNAYTGATNTIGSIHQRHWFLSLDKKNSGFTKTDGDWLGDAAPFYVMGRDYERSVVTGRTADEVMEDEGVAKFIGRKMWRPIIE